jgi:hypothetical protein
MGGPASSYATAGIALRITHHYVKVEIPSVGYRYIDPIINMSYVMRVPVTTAWPVLGLRMEETAFRYRR